MSNLVSIITPSYNSSKFIVECVNSVISQTFQNWEMIIVDDCSNDNSREIISDFSEKDKRIRFIFLEENIGAAASRNIAIKKAKGRYIAFLDSDDLWIKDKLERQITFIND
ncbi:MAG: glycosyltransferase family 2 protein, partial [Flavobacteriales bacterium]|nr:glycosyltransferase family 2 protein [Flavobacteriales bacterium]